MQDAGWPQCLATERQRHSSVVPVTRGTSVPFAGRHGSGRRHLPAHQVCAGFKRWQPCRRGLKHGQFQLRQGNLNLFKESAPDERLWSRWGFGGVSASRYCAVRGMALCRTSLLRGCAMRRLPCRVWCSAGSHLPLRGRAMPAWKLQRPGLRLFRPRSVTLAPRPGAGQNTFASRDERFLEGLGLAYHAFAG